MGGSKMEQIFNRAIEILQTWKGDSYTFGQDVLETTGRYVKKYGKKASLVVTGLGHGWMSMPVEQVASSLERNGIVFETIHGAMPNAPREDVYRIGFQVARARSEVIVAMGGGSTIDACKAAAVLTTYSPFEVMEILEVNAEIAGSIEPDRKSTRL